jgi:hypothetical protein
MDLIESVSLLSRMEPLINSWTYQHFLFGLGVSIVIAGLMRLKYRISTISLSILVLWELFEFRDHTTYWLTNYANNLFDILVGFVGVLIGMNLVKAVINYLTA